MEELSRKGHRQRIRDTYLKNGFDSMPDHNVLELILFYAIPQKDVKPLAYELINHFGSFNNVMNADVNELMKVKGVKEHTAVLISLFDNVNRRVSQNRANKESHTFESIDKYTSEMLKEYKNEVIMLVSFDNNRKIISTRINNVGTVNRAGITKKEIAEFVLRDNASSVLLAHNHPDGDPTPSMADISMTQSVVAFLREFNISLADHIIVGENGDTVSMKTMAKYALYFDIT